MKKLSATTLLAASAAAAAFAVGCAAGTANPTLALNADTTDVPADGVSVVTLIADVGDAPPGAVVTFDVQGVGLLSASNAEVIDGKASVELFAPFEDEITATASATSTTSTVAAHLAIGAVDVKAALPITFEIPTAGAPVLTAHTTPDRVVAGGPDSITLVVDGRRLTSQTITLTSSSAAVVLPPTMTLTDAGGGIAHGTLVIPPPAEPAEVTVHVAADGTPGVDVVLHFIAVDAPAFDLSGTFAEVQYGVVQIGGLFFLDPDPQCVIAPSISLVHVTQTGAHIAFETETCDIQMPAVNVILIGSSTTTVGPGFISASNANDPGPLEFDLDAVDAGAAFVAPAVAFSHPFIMGAHLAHETDDLPTDPTDSRVVDDDGDGNPGVTITNSSQGDEFVVMRTTMTSFTGTIESSDRVTGSASSQSQSNVLNGGGITPTVDDKASPWTMVRVDGANGATDISARDGDRSSITCADVLAFAAELQAQAQAPDTATACQ